MRRNWNRVTLAAITLVVAYACGPSSRVFHEREAAGAPSGEGGAAGEGGREAGASGEAGATSGGEAGASGRAYVGASGRGEAGANDGAEGGATGQATGGAPSVVGQVGQTSGGNGAGGNPSTAGAAPMPGPCPGECAVGQVGSESQPCGSCNTGTQTHTRTCSATCTWGAWSAWSACGNVTAECTPEHWTCCGTHGWMWCVTDTCKWSGDCDEAGCAASGACDC